MNVDEAIEEARQFGEQEPKDMLFAEHIAIELAAEVERLRAELALLRKDWCDDDEAIKQQALRVLPKFEVEGDSVHVPRMGELAEMMAGTALRYKEEGLAWMMAAQDKERELAAAGDGDTWREACGRLEAELAKVRAELAAAKAASVCPVEIESVYINKYIHAVVVFIGNEKGTLGFEAWLTKRQDKTPP